LLSPVIIEILSGKRVVNKYHIINLFNRPVYSVIGSILNNTKYSNHWIWGSGFISESGKIIKKPRGVLAVRGPLTRNKLLEQGIECPPIYGDPALLCSLLYKPNVNKRYKLGIIPHYIDIFDPLLNRFRNESGLIIIDIESGIKDVIDHINECDFIASSSLHGLIISDAYGIPSTWIKISDRIVGSDFKFEDYFASIGRKDNKAMIITDSTTIDDICSIQSDSEVNIDLEELLNTCPFIRKELTINDFKELFTKRINEMQSEGKIST